MVRFEWMNEEVLKYLARIESMNGLISTQVLGKTWMNEWTLYFGVWYSFFATCVNIGSILDCFGYNDLK